MDMEVFLCVASPLGGRRSSMPDKPQSHRFPSLGSRVAFSSQQGDQCFRENEAGPCDLTSIADPESAFRDKGHDVPIATGTNAMRLQKRTCVLGHVFQDRRCVSGDGGRKVNGERKASPRPCLCDLWQQPIER